MVELSEEFKKGWQETMDKYFLKVAGKGLKADHGKLDYSLIPFEVLEEMVKVLMYGVEKYKRDNWQLVEDSENRYFSAAFRHLIAWKSGEKLDKESSLNHLAHAAISIMFMLWKDKQIPQIK